MVGRDAGLNGCEDKNLAITADLKDSSAAITDVEAALAVEGDAGRNAQPLGVGSHRAILRYPIDSAVVARGDVEASIVAEGEAGGVHHFGNERLDFVAGINTEDGNWRFLSARTREGDVD